MIPDSCPPILYYHRVAPDADPATGITPERFRSQMRWLFRLGLTGITLLRGLTHGPGSGAFRPVVLTFDDGYADNYTYAAPIMEEFGFRGTIFFVAEKMGGTVDWTSDPVWKDHPLMSVAMARDLVSRGFEAGSHTLTHPDLRTLSDADARREIAESRPALAGTLSCGISTFCYPYGSYEERHLPMVREAGYIGARTVERTRFGQEFNPWRLPCRPVSGRMGLPRFVLTAASWRFWSR